MYFNFKTASSFSHYRKSLLHLAFVFRRINANHELSIMSSPRRHISLTFDDTNHTDMFSLINRAIDLQYYIRLVYIQTVMYWWHMWTFLPTSWVDVRAYLPLCALDCSKFSRGVAIYHLSGKPWIYYIEYTVHLHNTIMICDPLLGYDVMFSLVCNAAQQFYLLFSYRRSWKLNQYCLKFQAKHSFSSNVSRSLWPRGR